MKTKKPPLLPIIGCLVVQLCVGVIYLWSVLSTATREYYGWEAGQVKLIASFMLFAFCVGNFGGGALNDKFGPKKVSFIGVILFGVGIFLASCLPVGSGIVLFYLTYSIIGGLGVGITYGAILSCIQKWFPHKRGFATGIATAAFGLGTVAFSPVIGAMLKTMTVSTTLRILSIVFLVAGLVGCFVIKLPDEAYLAQLPKPASTKNLSAKKDMTLGEAIKTVPFWCLLFNIFFYNATWNMLNPMIAPLVKDGFIASGMGAERAASLSVTCVSLTGLFNAAGRFGMSSLSDKLGRIETVIMLCVVTIVCAMLLMFAKGWLCFIVVLITAFAFGGPSAVNPATSTDFFGAKYSGTNYGVAMLSLGFSSILFNAISNALDSNVLTFIMGAITAVITIVLMLIMKHYQKKQA